MTSLEFELAGMVLVGVRGFMLVLISLRGDMLEGGIEGRGIGEAARA